MDGANLRGFRILVVEDEYLLADDLRDALVSAGADVLGPAPSVEQATALIDAQIAFDAALLDVNLQGEMVFAVADTLERRGIPFAFVTGYTRAAIPARYADVTVMEKPLQFQQVAQLATMVLAQRADKGSR